MARRQSVSIPSTGELSLHVATNVHPTFVKGSRISLYQLWKGRRVVVAFLRHLGCRFCKQQSAQLISIAKKLVEHNVDLIFVSLGNQDSADLFLQESGYKGELYLDANTCGDPTLEPNCPEDGGNISRVSLTYRALRLRRGRHLFTEQSKALGEAAVLAGFNDNFAPGGTVDIYPGDIFQVGGVFVFDQDNSCDYAFRSAFFGHHPPLAEILRAATGVCANGNPYIFPSTLAWVSRMRMSEIFTEKLASAVIKNTPIRKGGLLKQPIWFIGVCVSIVVSIIAYSTLNTEYVYFHYEFKFFFPKKNSYITNFKFLKYFSSIHSIFTSTNQEARHLFVIAMIVAILFFLFDSEESPSIIQKLLSTIPKTILSLHKKNESNYSCPYNKNKKNLENPFPNVSTCPLLTPKDIDQHIQSLNHDDNHTNTITSNTIDQINVIEIFEPPESVENNDKSGMNHEISATDGHHNFDSVMNPYQEILCYLREFLAKPHPGSGRSGPVCPFMPGALRRNTIYMSVLHTGQLQNKDKVSMRKFIRRFLDRFLSLEPTSGTRRKFKTLILIFPDILANEAKHFIDDTQKACKIDFVRKGLMLGEFHLQNNTPGLQNPNFYPLRTPIPTLAIRHMVPGDLAFLDLPSLDTDVRIEFLQSFLNVFDSEQLKKSETATKTSESIVKARNALHDAIHAATIKQSNS